MVSARHGQKLPGRSLVGSAPTYAARNTSTDHRFADVFASAVSEPGVAMSYPGFGQTSPRKSARTGSLFPTLPHPLREASCGGSVPPRFFFSEAPSYLATNLPVADPSCTIGTTPPFKRGRPQPRPPIGGIGNGVRFRQYSSSCQNAPVETGGVRDAYRQSRSDVPEGH
jgi:hypothetical protein